MHDYFINLVVHFVDGDVAFGFLDGNLIAIGYVLADPARDILCRGVEESVCLGMIGRKVRIEHGIDILMVKGVFDDAFDVGKVGDHTVAVELLSAARDDDAPVVSVEVFALALVREIQIMCGGDLYCFLYKKHN